MKKVHFVPKKKTIAPEYAELAKRAKDAGTSLHALAVSIGVLPQTINNWKKKDPESIVMLRKFEAAIAQRLQEQPKTEQ